LHGAQRERRRTRGHSGRIVCAACGWSSARQGWISTQVKRCAIRAHLRVGVGGPVGVAPRRVPGQRKAPRLSAVSAPFAWSGIPSGVLVGSPRPGIQAGGGGTTTNGVLGDPGVGLCTAACMLARGSLGPCVRRLDGCRSWLRPRHARLTAGSPSRVGPQRIAAIAVRVRSWAPIGVLRNPSWLQKSSSDARLREATAVAAGVGDGSLAIVGRPTEANGVARARHRRRCRTRPARGEPLGGGRRLGPWQPSAFTGGRCKRPRWPGSQE